jgi:cell division protein FtsI/penicillin-binding protein 2
MGTYQSWKAYQAELKKMARRKKVITGGLWLAAPLLLIALGCFFYRVDLSSGMFSIVGGSETKPDAFPFTKEDFWHLIDPKSILNASKTTLEIENADNIYRIETTLDKRFQRTMTKKLRASGSPAVAFVAIDPSDGEIRSLVEFKNNDWADYVSLCGGFPAASIFKIISAAAAIEDCDFSAETMLSFNGRKHTLYKNQLKDGTNRYTNRVSLKQSFAQSINPAFGKLGIFQLKKGLLSEYAFRFGFNELIDFELPIEPSGFTIGDNPYQWAEIACGFNRSTVISPIHGAVIAAAVLNGGKLIAPSIVKEMADEDNRTVYKNGPHIIRQAISPKTSQELKKLMTETVARGTSRRTFRGYRRDRTLSKLVIGGKTGSIKNRSDNLLYDWFVGFGEEKKGSRKLAIAVLVVHDKLLRARAQEYARIGLREYFRYPPHMS